MPNLFRIFARKHLASIPSINLYLLLVGLLMNLAFAESEARASFLPRIGDEASYEVTTPIGSNVMRRVLEAFDAAKNQYQIVSYQENGGKIQKQADWVPAAQLEANYIENLNDFCAARGGQITSVAFDGGNMDVCVVKKDNGFLHQEDWFAAHLPFGIFLSSKKSPLHPKANTLTRLMSFVLQPR